MRILQICSARELGGGERHVADLSNGLAGRGHHVYAALIPSSPLLGELSALPRQNILELPMRNSLNVRSALKLARFVRENRIEIIHAHVARDYPLAALVAKRAGGVPLVLTRHVLFPLRKIHRLTLRSVARIIAVSQAVADGLRQQGIFSEDKIVLIHNGIDIDRFAIRSARRHGGARLQVGTIGHLAPIKGQEDFIRAAAIVCAQRDDVDFIIAGEDKSRTGEHRRRLEELIDELGLGKHVRLTGWVDDVTQLLSELDLFVSAARSEPFGLAIIEAMAAGVPVISTASEGAREIIEPDQTGRLITIGDVLALARAIGELLDDPRECEKLSGNARQVVSERFSLERMVDETEQVYRQALSLVPSI